MKCFLLFFLCSTILIHFILHDNFYSFLQSKYREFKTIIKVSESACWFKIKYNKIKPQRFIGHDDKEGWAPGAGTKVAAAGGHHGSPTTRCWVWCWFLKELPRKEMPPPMKCYHQAPGKETLLAPVTGVVCVFHGKLQKPLSRPFSNALYNSSLGLT